MVGGYEADGPIPISVPAPVPIASINEERKILRPPIVVSARGETYQNHNVSQHAGQTEHGDENDQLTSRVGAKTARFQNSLTPSELNNQSNGASDETGDSIFRHLDFAIIGHAKSGTSFMLNHWLRFHPDIRLPRNETRILREEEGATKIARLMKGLRKNDARALCGVRTQELSQQMFHFKFWNSSSQLSFPGVCLNYPVQVSVRCWSTSIASSLS